VRPLVEEGDNEILLAGEDGVDERCALRRIGDVGIGALVEQRDPGGGTVWPPVAASCSAVDPSGRFTFGSAPLSRSSFTTFSCPPAAACIRGVGPSFGSVFGFIPASISRRTAR
jgi:hypothetical protein